MSLVPAVSVATASNFLKSRFGFQQLEIEPREGGMMSRLFMVHANGDDYVLRFNTYGGYDKDAYAYQHFNSPNLPVPQVIAEGHTGKLNYCLSRRVVGESLSEEELRENSPYSLPLVKTLRQIHHQDIISTSGFGHWNGSGQGKYSSWQEHILAINNPELSVYWHSNKGYFEDGILEPQFFQQVYGVIQNLLEFSPNQRILLHGDYGGSNLLLNQGCVSAVLDWAEGQYGDPLLDVGYLEYIRPERNLGEIYRQICEQERDEITNFDERLLCYQLYTSLADMQVCASAFQGEGYPAAKSKAVKLLAQVNM